MPFIDDPQGREEVEKVSRRLKLPVWKSYCKGDFRKWWNEWWDKIDTFAEEIEAIEIKTGTGLEGGGNLTKNRTLDLKKATKTELGGIIVGDNLTVDATGKLNGNPAVDISGKMDKYQARYDMRDYDDLIEDGFYILTGSASSSPSANAPYGDSALVQVWTHSNFVYQHAVSYYSTPAQFTRCFQKGVKNTKWASIVNTANYSLMCPYSIGDIMLTVSTQNPAVKWIGTTWEKIEGRFLLGSSSSYVVGATAGSTTSVLTVANLPSHTHSATQSAHAHTQPAHSHIVTSYEGGNRAGVSNYNAGYNAVGTQATGGAGGDNTGSAQPAITVGYTGSGTAFNNMPPYIVVNIWKRIS